MPPSTELCESLQWFQTLDFAQRFGARLSYMPTWWKPCLPKIMYTEYVNGRKWLHSRNVHSSEWGQSTTMYSSLHPSLLALIRFIAPDYVKRRNSTFSGTTWCLFAVRILRESLRMSASRRPYLCFAFSFSVFHALFGPWIFFWKTFIVQNTLADIVQPNTEIQKIQYSRKGKKCLCCSWHPRGGWGTKLSINWSQFGLRRHSRAVFVDRLVSMATPATSVRMGSRAESRVFIETLQRRPFSSHLQPDASRGEEVACLRSYSRWILIAWCLFPSSCSPRDAMRRDTTASYNHQNIMLIQDLSDTLSLVLICYSSCIESP